MQTQSWSRRPVSAAAVRAAAVLLPMAVGLLVAFALTRAIERPAGLAGTLAWWLGIMVVATLAVRLTDRWARRLLPLAVLMRVSLAFPDKAPPRLRLALRSGNTRNLEELLADAEAAGREDDLTRAAETILALAAALNAHDPRTRGHVERVRAYADLLGEEMGFNAEDRNKLKWAAMLHDIGKLRVPSRIINKTSRLTGGEWEVVRHHPDWGMELAAPLADWLGDYIFAIGQHHERWDGSGYPAGLAGGEITLAARIASVADAYDTMTSVRSYKDARSAEAAREELARAAGTHFDPEVVRNFLNIAMGRQRTVAGPLSWAAAQVPLLQGALRTATGLATNAATAVQTTTAAAAVAATAAAAPISAVAEPVLPMITEPPITAHATITTTTTVSAPNARNDKVSVTEDSDIVVEVLANDEGEVDAVQLVNRPAHGTAWVTGDGEVRYAPNPDYAGPDQLRYEICDAAGRCDRAAVEVTVAGVNDPPRVPGPGSLAVTAGDSIRFDPLAGATDPEGSSPALAWYEATSVAGGAITEGSLIYTAPAAFNGSDSFQYAVADGSGAETVVTVRVEVLPAPTTTTRAPTTTTRAPTTTTLAPTTTTTTNTVPTTTTTISTTTTTTTTSTTSTSTPTTTQPVSAAMFLYSLDGHDHKEDDSWLVHVDLQAKDEFGDKVAGAVVTLTITNGGQATAVTNKDGKIRFEFPNLPSSLTEFKAAVATITHPERTYKPALNREGSTVIVKSPFVD